MSTVAGALEPCGCHKDMLGGVDHAAAWLARQRASAQHSLVVGAGPMLFADPTLPAERRQQDLWKADALATSFAAIGLKAWAPGVNDFAAGVDTLRELSHKSQADLLAANVALEGASIESLEVFEVGGYKVGVAGIGAPPTPLPGAKVETDHAAVLRRAAAALTERGAQIRVALLATERGEALRLAERAPEFHVIALGKPSQEGEANDAPVDATLVGDTLVVQAPNHLQAIAHVDFFVRDGKLRFEDGTGLALAEQKESLARRIAALEQRVTAWQAKAAPSAEELSGPRAEIERQKSELARLSQQRVEPKGSFFRYELTPIRESFGSEPNVHARMLDYYKRVNEHNRVAFADRKPPEPAPGAARYVGGEECSTCHSAADEFWQKTPHARAYPTLQKDHKEFNLDCVGCHVTGYEKPGGSSVVHVEGLTNVQCEACHGPGSLHVASPTTPGLVTRKPSEATCKGCHHPPHVADSWDVTEAWPHVLGPGHGQPIPSAR